MSYDQPPIWRNLILSTQKARPLAGQLVALRFIPLNDSAYYDDRFDIGTFETDERTGRKLWWHGTRGTEDPCQLQKKYDIAWHPIDRP